MGASEFAQKALARQLDTLSAPAVLVGLIGASIGRSRTPLMHEREGARLGLRYIYRLLDATTPVLDGRDVSEILDAARICGFAGLNVTYPFKQAIIPHLDELSDNARRVGAVNTVVLRAGKAMGHNTDLWGFAEGFRRDMGDVARGTVLQLGAGGAGSAVAHALAQLEVKRLLIADIETERAEKLAEAVNARAEPITAEAVRLADLSPAELDGMVNTTPVGMDANPGLPVPREFFHAAMWVSDIVYFPLETQFLRVARAAGCRCQSGASMAVFQAVRAFELFTGIAPDAAAMKSTFDAFDRGPVPG